MRLIDTHAHLDFPGIQERFEEVLEAAAANGVERIVTIGASRGLETNFKARAIAAEHENIRCTAGIHPHDAGEVDLEECYGRIAGELAGDAQVVAIGEIGLDYFYDKAPKERQIEVFRRFCQLSREVDKPVVIHSREAEEDTLEVFEEEGIEGGIMHCFTGSRQMAEACLERGFYISFSGIVTFKSARDLLETAKIVPRERILFETDSPYLAPVPKRGKKNEPAFVLHTARALAEARGESVEELSEAVWENASRVFGWP